MKNERPPSPESHDIKSKIVIPEKLLSIFATCKRPILPGMKGIRFHTLDEFSAKGGEHISKIPYRLKALQETYNNSNASIKDFWLVLRDYENLFKGLQFAQMDGIPVDELLSQVQELGYNALIRAAETLLRKLKESYVPQTNTVDETKGISQDEFREINFWFKDFFKNILVTGHEIPPELEASYHNFLRNAKYDEKEIIKRSDYAREEARKILES